MKFDEMAIALEPRSTLQCLDLALMFFQRHLRAVLQQVACLAMPCCAFVYVMMDRFELNLPLAAGVFYFASAVLGVLVINGAGPTCFGAPWTFQTAWRRASWRQWAGCLAIRCLEGLGALACLLPGLLVGARTAFWLEQDVLSGLDKQLRDRRLGELLRGESLELIRRFVVILFFCSLLSLTLFFVLDFGCQLLLGLPILFGRLAYDPQYLGNDSQSAYVANFVWGDPPVVTALLAVAFLAYPVGRMAWMLCYLDLRVRRDCWDMELQILRESRRLQEGWSSAPAAGGTS